MPAVASIVLGFLLGVLLASASGEDTVRAEAGRIGPALLVVVAFGVIVYAPASAYVLALSPDWALSYMIDSRLVPRSIDALLALACALAPALGHALTTRLGAQSTNARIRLALVPLAVLAALLAVGARRLSIHATFAQYHGDFGVQPVAGSPLGWALLWMAVVLTGAVVWLGHRLRRIGTGRD